LLPGTFCLLRFSFVVRRFVFLDTSLRTRRTDFHRKAPLPPVAGLFFLVHCAPRAARRYSTHPLPFGEEHQPFLRPEWSGRPQGRNLPCSHQYRTLTPGWLVNSFCAISQFPRLYSLSARRQKAHSRGAASNVATWMRWPSPRMCSIVGELR
jgi:hypothetical protein